MLYKKILLPVMASVCFVWVCGQRMVLAPLFTGKGLTINNQIKDVSKPFQLKPLHKDSIVITSGLPRFLKPSCITHDPFTFLQFDASRKNNAAVALEFETINEYTSRSFIIERVYAQGTEEADITKPADTCYQFFVQAKKVADFSNADSAFAKNRHGNTYKYKLTDNNNYSGITFYRITETDLDNSTVTTKIIAVPGRPLKETAIVYPNPVANSAAMKVYSKYAGNSTVQVLTLNGIVLKQFSTALEKGVNNIILNVPGFTNGMYVVRILRDAHPALQANLVKL